MFNDYEDMFEEQEDFNFQPNDSIAKAVAAYQQMLMRRLVEENFNNIATKGFSDEQVKQWDFDSIDALTQTFDFMIAEYEAEEEYEKCAILVQARQAVIDRKAFKPLNI